MLGIAPQVTKQLGLLIDQIEVMALEHVQRETGAGFFLPVEQFLDRDTVLLAAKHMDRHAQWLALAILEAAAGQEVGAKNRQHQLHQFIVGNHVLAGALELAQAGDQLFIGLGHGVFAYIATHRPCRGREKHDQRCRQATCAQDMRQLEGQQGAEAMSENRVGFIQFDADLIGQAIGQLYDIGLQRLIHAHATPWQLKRANVQPLGQLAPPRAVEHRTGPGKGQAEQRQVRRSAHVRPCHPIPSMKKLRCARNPLCPPDWSMASVVDGPVINENGWHLEIISRISTLRVKSVQGKRTRLQVLIRFRI
ncbi:hypothetical protein ALQ04_05427 [Pseudomonas cichorii]|uniref:Uncharacterized protein n=1 Tax=Pseudomonas cichorii TaxID=36746 RepID=A0A3M4MAN5_PSECI|nr:hypothetical protein ALQ04_05427 [Pseudomonas cichorii]